LTDWSF
jgi:hypothetical protein